MATGPTCPGRRVHRRTTGLTRHPRRTSVSCQDASNPTSGPGETPPAAELTRSARDLPARRVMVGRWRLHGQRGCPHAVSPVGGQPVGLGAVGRNCSEDLFAVRHGQSTPDARVPDLQCSGGAGCVRVVGAAVVPAAVDHPIRVFRPGSFSRSQTRNTKRRRRLSSRSEPPRGLRWVFAGEDCRGRRRDPARQSAGPRTLFGPSTGRRG